jgi:hypothetical protein
VLSLRLKANALCIFIIVSAVMLACSLTVQANPSISLSFYKNNGYGLGNDMNGYFTLNAAVSQDVTRVEFYIDNQLVENDTSAPFSWPFNTEDYALGSHTMKAVAFDASNQTATASVERNFVSFPTTFVVGIIVAVIVVAVIVPLVWAINKIRKGNKEKTIKN